MKADLNYFCHLMKIRSGSVSEWMENHLSHSSPVGILVELILGIYLTGFLEDSLA